MGLGNITFGGNNVRFGNDADKPKYPNVGDEYTAIDTQKKYICYENNIWKSMFDLSQVYKDVQRLDKQVWNTETELSGFTLENCFLNGDKINLNSITSQGVLRYGYETLTSKTGIEIRVKKPTTQLKFFLNSNNSNVSKIYVVSSTTNNILYTQDVTESPGELITINYNFDTSDYLILVDNDGNDYTPAIDDMLEYSYYINGETIDIITGIENNNTAQDKRRVFDYIIDMSPAGSATSPEVTPANLAKWEYAYFEIDPDGETITADILDAANDSVLIENISDGESLHDISSDTNLKIRFNLSRADTANNPKVYNAILKWINVLS